MPSNAISYFLQLLWPSLPLIFPITNNARKLFFICNLFDSLINFHSFYFCHYLDSFELNQTAVVHNFQCDANFVLAHYFMSQQYLQRILQSPFLITYIFILPLTKVLEHLSIFSTNINGTKICRLVYLVKVYELTDFMQIQKQMLTHPRYHEFKVCLTPFEKQDDMKQHIKMMERMGQNQFQDQYIEMLDLLEKEIQKKLIITFCRQEFCWTETKTLHFMEMEKINTIHNLLHYPKFNVSQTVKINKMWDMIKMYLNGGTI